MQTRNNTVKDMLEIDQSMKIDEMIDIKVVMLGDISVGKTSIVSRFQKSQFDINQSSTVGGSYVVQIKKYNNDQNVVKFQIQDTAGQEQFRSLVSIYYKDAQAAILVYDSTNDKSFQNLQGWFDELQNKGPKDIITIIAANKQDLITENQINIDKVYDLTKKKNSTLHFTSAKNGSGIEEMFQDLANHFIKNYKRKKLRTNTKLSVVFNNQSNADKKKCCG